MATKEAFENEDFGAKKALEAAIDKNFLLNRVFSERATDTMEEATVIRQFKKNM